MKYLYSEITKVMGIVLLLLLVPFAALWLMYMLIFIGAVMMIQNL